MKHDVLPQSSGTSAVALAESPEPGAVTTTPVPAPAAEPPGASDAPGPISWDLAEGGPIGLPEEVEAAATGDPSAGPESSGIATVELSAGPVEEAIADPLAGEDPGVRAAPVPAVWSLGPVGRRRNLGLFLLLSVLTLGLYTVVWFARANREMREFDPRMYARPGRTALAISVPVLASLLVCGAAGTRLLLEHLGHSADLTLSSNVTVWFLAAPLIAPWLALLLPFSIVAAAMTVERLRVVEDRAGTAPDLQARPVSSLRWLLLPAVGVVVLGVTIQARMNRVWSIALP
jgi:hypothetical protein